MFCKRALVLLILTVTMVTKSAVAQPDVCPEVSEGYGGLFTDCGPKQFPNDYAMCCLRGDPHIRTFDGHRYNFGAKGYFYAVGPCEDKAGLKIIVYIWPRKLKPTQFRIVGVEIIKNGKTYKITFKKNKVKAFTVDGDVKTLQAFPPYKDDHSLAFINPGKASEIIFRCAGVKIRINCKFHSVYIWISRELKNVCGLCGYFNGHDFDDTHCMLNCNDEIDDGNCVSNETPCPVEFFGNLWMVDEDDHQSGEGGEGGEGGGGKK